MTYIRTFGKLLAGLGVLGFVGATAWWYMFFEGLLGTSVKEASACFYQTTSSCEVGNMIGAFGEMPTYSPMALWVSVGLFVGGGLIYGLAGAKR